MRRPVILLLTAAMLLSVTSCTAGNTSNTEGTSAATETTTTETEATTASESSETEDEASYVSSGYLEGLRIGDNNTFSNKDSKYGSIVKSIDDVLTLTKFEGSIMLATDDEIIYYGGTNAKTVDGDPVDPFTTYNIASCSKTFTACCIFQLIEQGKLSLDDTLDKYFPKYKAAKDVTIYDMLHNVSGIPDWMNEPDKFWVNIDSEEEYMQEWIKAQQDKYTDEEFLDVLYDAPLMFEPKSQYSYSNTNFRLLAMIVEQISGMRFCDYLKENVFDKCGMEHSSSMKAADETSVPRSFDAIYKQGVVNSDGYYMEANSGRGEGGVHSCMADVLAFDKALFSGKLISYESLAKMMDWKFDYGCGLMNMGDNYYGHTGQVPCYRTFNVIFETKEYGKVYAICSTAAAADPIQQRAYNTITFVVGNTLG